MPELSRFFGIVITVFFEDHNPPHVHAYGGNRRHPDWAAQIAIHNGVVLDGEAPSLALRLVRKWIKLHSDELHEAWNAASEKRTPKKIKPLRVR